MCGKQGDLQPNRTSAILDHQLKSDKDVHDISSQRSEASVLEEQMNKGFAEAREILDRLSLSSTRLMQNAAPALSNNSQEPQTVCLEEQTQKDIAEIRGILDRLNVSASETQRRLRDEVEKRKDYVLGPSRQQPSKEDIERRRNTQGGNTKNNHAKSDDGLKPQELEPSVPATNPAPSPLPGTVSTASSQDTQASPIAGLPLNPGNLFANTIKSLVNGVGLLASEIQNNLPEAEELAQARQNISRGFDDILKKSVNGLGAHVQRSATALQEAADVTREAADRTREAELQALEGAVQGLHNLASGIGEFGKSLFSSHQSTTSSTSKASESKVETENKPAAEENAPAEATRIEKENKPGPSMSKPESPLCPPGASAYNFYAQEQRAVVQADNPGVAIGTFIPI
jgi:hypothetical protein